MCNLSKGVENRGIRKGIIQGREEGREEEKLNSIRNVMGYTGSHDGTGDAGIEDSKKRTGKYAHMLGAN